MQKYDHKVRCNQLGVGDLVLLRRITCKGKHKFWDHWEKTIYQVEGLPYVGFPVFMVTLIAGEGKVQILQ